MDLKFLQIFLLFATHRIDGRANDYFSGSFDINKNCLKEELMKNLTKESYPRCATVVEGVVYVFSDYCQALVPVHEFQSQSNEIIGLIGTGTDNKII